MIPNAFIPDYGRRFSLESAQQYYTAEVFAQIKGPGWNKIENGSGAPGAILMVPSDDPKVFYFAFYSDYVAAKQSFDFIAKLQ